MKRTLQVLLFILSLIPLRTVIRGFAAGAGWGAVDAGFTVDFDSHYRYLSAVYVVIPLVIWYVLPNIEKHAALVRIVCFAVFLGGVNRLVSLVTVGVPSPQPVAFLVLELIVPIFAIMQARLARASQRAVAVAVGD